MNIKELQINLSAMGYDPGAIDGLWGPNTKAACKELLLDHVGLRVRDVAVAAEQLIMREAGGLLVGPIDGIVGPATRKARAQWLRGNWRDVMLRAVSSDERMPVAVKTRWPTYAELTNFFGRPGENLVTITVPFKLRLAWQLQTKVQRVTCHAKVADSILAVQERILRSYGPRDVERLHLDIWGGCYNFRRMRGSGRLSTHSWGIAWDTDPVRNAMHWGKDQANLASPVYKEFWDAWTDEGWLSLGKARDFDWMHVQACRL